MKKTKSSTFLKIPSLGASLRKSGIREWHNNNTNNKYPVLSTARSIANLTTTKLVRMKQQSQTEATSNNECTLAMMKPSTILKNKVAMLHKSIQLLQTEISESKQLGKNKGKDYEQQLNKYDQVSKQLHNCQKSMQIFKSKIEQIQNNISMLHEDFQSTQMHMQQGLAEKEYCDQILSQYTREFENEASLVLLLLAKQNENLDLHQQINRLQEEIMAKQKQLSQWKKQFEYDLQQKIAKNKITQLRIDLMKAEEQVNSYANSFKLMKLRQILCIFLKQKSQSNRNFVNSQMLSQQGMQIYLCRNDGLYDFQQAVYNYRGKQKCKYTPQSVQKYFNILFKIESQVNNAKLKLNKKINCEYTQKMSLLRKTLLQKQQKIKINSQQIQEIKQKIQVVFANESVAIIEHLRESTGKYQLNQIKSTLKNLKQQQKSRIDKISGVFRTDVQLSRRSFQLNSAEFMNQLSEFKCQKDKVCSQLKQMQYQQKGLKSRKQQIQNQISLAVSKWSEVSCKKEELKQLYKQLSKLNKQVRQAERIYLQQKQSKTYSNAPLTKNNQLMAKTMRETLKLRITGNAPKNKQNEIKLTNRYEVRQPKKWSFMEENCKTRKQSVNDDHQKNAKPTLHWGNLARDSLTALLMTKFIN